MYMKKSPKILLIEDDDIDVEFMARGIKRYKLNCEMVRAENGLEAINMLKGLDEKERLESPYVVFLDLNMPQMNGLEFLDELRKDDELKDTVVFVVSTSDDENDKALAYGKQIAGYFLKSDINKDQEKFMEMSRKFLELAEFPEK